MIDGIHGPLWFRGAGPLRREWLRLPVMLIAAWLMGLIAGGAVASLSAADIPPAVLAAQQARVSTVQPTSPCTNT